MMEDFAPVRRIRTLWTNEKDRPTQPCIVEDPFVCAPLHATLEEAVWPVRVMGQAGQGFHYKVQSISIRQLREHLLHECGETRSYLAGPNALAHHDQSVGRAALEMVTLLPECIKEQLHEVCPWMGRHGQRTRMHFDLCHNLLQVIEGRKWVILAPPDDFLNLETYTARDLPEEDQTNLRRMYRFSRADVRSPGWREEFPRLRRCHLSVAQVNAGESLFIPLGWFHDVLSEGVVGGLSVAVNCFWGGPEEEDMRKHKWMRIFVE
jgi:hypothetical protein